MTGQRVTISDWVTRNPEAARRLNLARYGGTAKFDAAIQRSAQQGWLATAPEEPPPAPDELVARVVAARGLAEEVLGDADT